MSSPLSESEEYDRDVDDVSKSSLETRDESDRDVVDDSSTSGVTIFFAGFFDTTVGFNSDSFSMT